MKLISSIRNGLAQIPGALEAIPPEQGYEGSEEAVRHARTLWSGEDLHLLSPGSDQTWEEPAFPEGEVEEDILGLDAGSGWFDPVFEIGADMEQRFPGLGGTHGEKIHQSVQLNGMDALGWYVSFHHPGVQWGIYIPVSGIKYLVQHAFLDLSAPASTKCQIAFHAILSHELFHFATDYTIAQAELAHQEPWFVPAKSAFRLEKPHYCIEEEQLANAYMLSAFRSMKPALRVNGKQAALRAFVGRQPVGYRDALHVRPPQWDRLLSKLARRYGTFAMQSSRHPLLWESFAGFDWAHQFPIRPRINWRYCPIHFVDDGERVGLPPGWLSVFSRLSAIQESPEFRKKLETLAAPIRRAWERTKQRLMVAITAGVDFKKWEKGGNDLFSVRINDNFRAHLQRRKEMDDWLAVAIGSHKEMGHG